MSREWWFCYGMRAASWFAGTLPFAFLAGVFHRLRMYEERTVKNFEQDDRSSDWSKRYDSGFRGA